MFDFSSFLKVLTPLTTLEGALSKYLSLFSACGFGVLGKRLHFFPFALGNCLPWPSPVLLQDETLRACERIPRGGRQSGLAFPEGNSFSVVLW